MFVDPIRERGEGSHRVGMQNSACRAMFRDMDRIPKICWRLGDRDGRHTRASVAPTVVGVQSGRALDDPGWSTASGTQMDIWTINNGNNQKWTLNNLGNNTVKLINVFSGLALEVKQSLKTNGAVVDQATYTGAANQQWTVVQVSSGIYNLKNVNSGEVLDVAGKKTADGTLVDQWPSNNGTNQQWKFQ